jgi:hypothetical protein
MLSQAQERLINCTTVPSAKHRAKSDPDPSLGRHFFDLSGACAARCRSPLHGETFHDATEEKNRIRPKLVHLLGDTFAPAKLGDRGLDAVCPRTWR